MFKKLKRFLFGIDRFAENINETMKSKVISTEDKVDYLVAEYKNFFKNDVNKRATIDTLELHYETFMINGVQDNKKYNKCFINEFENGVFYHIFVLANNFKKLTKKGLKADLLNEENLAIYNDCMDFSNKYINKDFNGGLFYTDKKFRDNMTSELVSFINKHFPYGLEKYNEALEYVEEPFAEFNK